MHCKYAAQSEYETYTHLNANFSVTFTIVSILLTTHTYACMYTHANTHAHTHTHSLSFSLLFSLSLSRAHTLSRSVSSLSVCLFISRTHACTHTHSLIHSHSLSLSLTQIFMYVNKNGNVFGLCSTWCNVNLREILPAQRAVARQFQMSRLPLHCCPLLYMCVRV